MLTCEYVSKRLSCYFDGTLKASLSEQITRHVDTCQSCQRELEAIKAISAAIKEKEILPVTDEFRSKLHMSLISASLDNETERIPSRLSRPIWWTSFSAVIVCCLLMVVILNRPDVSNGFDLITADTNDLNGSETMDEAGLNIKVGLDAPEEKNEISLNASETTNKAALGSNDAVASIQEREDFRDIGVESQEDMMLADEEPGMSPKNEAPTASGGGAPAYEARRDVIRFKAANEADLQAAYGAAAAYCSLSRIDDGYEGMVKSESIEDLIDALEAVDDSAVSTTFAEEKSESDEERYIYVHLAL